MIKTHIIRYLIPVLSVYLFFTPLYSKIYKRIHKDGTIEYYNKNYSKRKQLNNKYDKIINRLAEKQGLDPFLIKCIIKIESNFNPNAVSVAGAMGLMQIMQGTARIYSLTDPFDPEKNIEAGIKHFSSLLKYFKNDIPLALAAYNAGIGRVRKRMSIPSIKSTINYVNNVMYLYKGKGNYRSTVKKLYQRIEKDGTIMIYSK